LTTEPIFQYDPETMESICILTSGNTSFVGKAQCHKDDADFASEKTGQTIAQFRATIKYFQHIKNNELKPKLNALKQLYYSMNRSKHFNPKSYEAKMLFRQIRLKEEDLEFCKNAIQKTKRYIKEYIDQKEQNYQLIRKKRKNK
jgi:hypothetical protein